MIKLSANLGFLWTELNLPAAILAGDNGLTAVPGREAEAREYIDQAIEYAAAIQCINVHVMAGFTDQGETAELTFRDNLNYACQRALEKNIQILIEPLNQYDAPGYHLNNIDSAIQTIEAVNAVNLKVMFDCYHIQIMQGDLGRRIKQHLPSIGHIQFAAVPDRGEPDLGS